MFDEINGRQAKEITCKDIEEFLTRFGIPFEENEVKIMIGKEKIDYTEFERLVLPRSSKTLASQAKSRAHLIDKSAFLIQ